jgi:hypothetical protein
MPSIRSLLTLTAAMLAALALGSATASADCCMGPWVNVGVKPDTLLTAKLRLTIGGDDPDHQFNATVRPYLNVGTHRIARLPAFSATNVGIVAQRRTLRVPARVRRAAVRYGIRTHHRRATLKFVVRGATDIATGAVRPTYGLDSFLLLPRR